MNKVARALAVVYSHVRYNQNTDVILKGAKKRGRPFPAPRARTAPHAATHWDAPFHGHAAAIKGIHMHPRAHGTVTPINDAARPARITSARPPRPPRLRPSRCPPSSTSAPRARTDCRSPDRSDRPAEERGRAPGPLRNFPPGRRVARALRGAQFAARCRRLRSASAGGGQRRDEEARARARARLKVPRFHAASIDPRADRPRPRVSRAVARLTLKRHEAAAGRAGTSSARPRSGR